MHIEAINRTLKKLGKNTGFAASIWGSLLRDEMTPLSDVDIICYSNDGNDYSEKVAADLKNNFKSNISWDVAFTGKSTYEYATQNGTNFHSVYFSDIVVGDEKATEIFSAERDKVRNESEIVIRELFNLFTSYWGLANVILVNDDRYSKFSLNGTNKWVRLIQAAQLKWDFLNGKKSLEILEFLSNEYKLDFSFIKESYLKTFNERVISESKKRSFVSDSFDSAWSLLFNAFFADCVTWIQSISGVEKNLLVNFLHRLSPANTIQVPSPSAINTKATVLLKSFLSATGDELEETFLQNKNDWWTLTNICINPNTPPTVLQKIVFPDFQVDTKLWKSIRLYVSKNKNTDKKTLEQILNTRGLREQDYLAAQANLNYKKNYE